MSQNLEFDKAIEELRAERAPDVVRDRSLRAIARPQPRHLPLRSSLVGTAAVALVAAFLLLPGRRNGLAFAEVLRRTQAVSTYHITYLNPQGKKVGEQWRSGPMWALWIGDGKGRILDENRSDLQTFYYYVYRAELNSLNAVQYGTLVNRTQQMIDGSKKFDWSPTVKSLVDDKRYKLVGQGTAQLDGKTVQQYQLQMTGNTKQTVDADPQSGLILSVTSPGNETQRYDYPDSIDPVIFSYKSRVTKDLVVLDLRGKEDPRKNEFAMPPVLASKGGIQLRSVGLGVWGDLFITWTGYLPKGKAVKRLRVVGLSGPTLWLNYENAGTHKDHGKLIVYRFTPSVKVGERVTVRIPTPTSFVEFKDVKVVRPERLREGL